MKQIVRYKDREEWLQARTNGIGASEVGTILGLNPFETPLQLWRRKKGLDAPKAENFAMKAGHFLEDAVSRFYADETGCTVIKNTAEDFSILNPEKPYLRVSPDRLFWRYGVKRSDKQKSVLECKTTQMDIDEDNVPQHWFCQLQMNMGVGEYRDGALAWLTQGREFGYKDFTFNVDFFGWMVDEVEKFWTDNIIGDKEPEPISTKDLMLKYSRHTEGKTAVADDTLAAQCRKLKSIQEELCALDAKKKEISSAIKLAMKDAEALVIPDSGITIATWKSNKSSTKFDEKRFSRDYPELYAKYQYQKAGSRVFLLK